jgi:hypothetical protein
MSIIGLKSDLNDDKRCISALGRYLEDGGGDGLVGGSNMVV